MTRLLVLLFLIGTASTSAQAPQVRRVFMGEPPAPVASGEIWLIGNRWGAYPAVLVAKIRNGELRPRNGVEFPLYWDQAFNYTVLVATSDRPTLPPRSPYQDFGYEVSRRPPYLNPFPDIYLSTPLPAQNLGMDWRQGLQELGVLSGDALILPPPRRRTIRLEYPDGRPLANATVPLSLYGSSENHCGVAVGIDLGEFRTDSHGVISFLATASPLAVDLGYFEERAGGPAGTSFSVEPDLTVGGDQHITLKRIWTLPSYNYVIRLRAPNGRPVTGARVTACMQPGGACGALCGPLPAHESDVAGVVRFHTQDLREMRSVTLEDAAGRKRDLSEQEMSVLFTTHQLQLVW